MIRKVPSYKTQAGTLPFLTFEWVTSWHETIGKEWELYMLNANKEVIAPFARNNNEVIIAGGNEVADYLDIVGADEAKTIAWPEILDFLKHDGVTSLHLNNIPENSPTVDFFKGHVTSVITQEDTTPMMTLPPILDKKSRHEMERKIRKFERENAHITIKDGNNIELLLSLMKLDPQKKEFLTPDMEQFFRKMHTMGTITEILIGNTTVAALLAFRVDDTVMSYNSGFDETNFSGAGFYLKAMHIKRASESGIKTYNFLQGSERYKYELGGKDFFVYRIDMNI
jgi:CelD/BcsL family acetyltransferase involved in cellulose biosynthesis